MTPRVVIADDHPFFRQGLARALERFGIEVLAEAANGSTAIKVVQQTAPDVAVIDLNMPVLSGVDVTRRLVHRTPATRVLILSVSAEEADVTDAILAGAAGYVLKDVPVEEVVAAVRAVAAGESLISPRIASMLLARIREREQLRPGRAPLSLTLRELEVLRLVAAGRNSHEIGDALLIEPGTVRTRISRALMKLQIDNRIQTRRAPYQPG